MPQHSLTIGADPEVFLYDIAGEYVSAIDKIGGSKAEPRQLERPGFALQEDNVAVEFNIPPAKDLASFCESIEWSIKRITEEVKPMGFTVAIIPAAIFPESELQDPRAKHAGCDPDFNAWTKQRNPRPRVAESNLRTGAGHVHVGISPKPQFSREAFIKSLDLNLGVGSVIFDNDILRKNLYGKAGAFRPTRYGLEYRVLSNFWLKSRKLTKWVYNQTHAAFSMVEQRGEEFFDKIGNEIQTCINTSDKVMAQNLIKRYSIASI